ncbi:hypothetical protein DFH08DRAFT_819868 [Mycena albidolilacea]|uniref:Uncharacterized protein n=1 Tax=Mycena albidolilacea TaxID=1033008 RepID=A0AAD6ZE80_9AGAR|nr:hypothetical protein DFH08DRAFT_819868 [Mycena albidolilacea]
MSRTKTILDPETKRARRQEALKRYAAKHQTKLRASAKERMHRIRAQAQTQTQKDNKLGSAAKYREKKCIETDGVEAYDERILRSSMARTQQKYERRPPSPRPKPSVAPSAKRYALEISGLFESESESESASGPEESDSGLPNDSIIPGSFFYGTGVKVVEEKNKDRTEQPVEKKRKRVPSIKEKEGRRKRPRTGSDSQTDCTVLGTKIQHLEQILIELGSQAANERLWEEVVKGVHRRKLEVSRELVIARDALKEGRKSAQILEEKSGPGKHAPQKGDKDLDANRVPKKDIEEWWRISFTPEAETYAAYYQKHGGPEDWREAAVEYNCWRKMMQADSTAQPGNASGSQILPPWSSMQRDNSSSSGIYPPWLICGEIQPRRRIQPLNDISQRLRGSWIHPPPQAHADCLTARVSAPGPGWRPSLAAINCEHLTGRYGRKQPEEQVVQQELQYISQTRMEKRMLPSKGWAESLRGQFDGHRSMRWRKEPTAAKMVQPAACEVPAGCTTFMGYPPENAETPGRGIVKTAAPEEAQPADPAIEHPTSLTEDDETPVLKSRSGRVR